MFYKQILYIQKWLVENGYELIIDGQMGIRTKTAICTHLKLEMDLESKLVIIFSIQLIAKLSHVDVGNIDGIWGPKTEKAFKQLLNAPKFKITNWPVQKESELIKHYGQVGENQTRIKLPYPHVLSWDVSKQIHSFSCHEKVHDSLLRVLNRVLDFYGEEEIKRLNLDKWGGCLNVRTMRGGSRHSLHSWGIAVDYDPIHNQLKWGRDKASFAKPEYDKWWYFWEQENWTSLGRAKNRDFMHVQAAHF